MARKKKSTAVRERTIDDEELNRFAGSSDEDEEETPDITRTEDDDEVRESENERSDEPKDEDEQSDENVAEEIGNDEPFVTNEKKDFEPAEKMSSAISRILGSSAPKTSTVLAKTVTPLQRLQNEEKQRQKALREKRNEKKERNLAAFHIPMSVATTNQLKEGRVSLSKELAQERFHRRVATRGVVALFNAISQHQVPSESHSSSSDKPATSKLTKHMFLDKIKSSATDKRQQDDLPVKRKPDSRQGKGAAPAWDSLKDDYMMKSKANWDEESSDGDDEEPEQPPENEVTSQPKRRRVQAN